MAETTNTENQAQEPDVQFEKRWTPNVEKHGWLKNPPESLEVKKRTEDMEKRITQFDSEHEIYSMKECGKKICLIIGNTTFNNIVHLEGCAVDCLYLSALFTKLNFDVEVKQNLKAQEMMEFLTPEKRDLKGIECFVCAITSHGERDGVLGSDRLLFKFQDIMNLFDRCPDLANKPKLFLFDFCRGETKDQCKAMALAWGDRHSTFIKPPGFEYKAAFGDETMIPPIKSDILVAHATSYDHVSFSNLQYGSWFFRSFVKVVSENACRYNILDMLLKVNELVGTFRTTKGCVQSAQFECSMRKQFFFSLPVIPVIRQEADKPKTKPS